MEYKEIKLNDWIRTGEGASASSYVNRNDDNYMLKLFNKNIRFEIIEKEFMMAKTVTDLSISTPMVYEIVKSSDKFGIIYQNIKNKKSITRWLESDLDKYIKIFASETRKLHSKTANTDKLKSQKLVLKNLANNINGLDSSKRKKLLKIIDDTAETNTCIHGDLSTGNLIVANDNPYWIDLADFAYGNPVFDIGMIYFDCKSDVFKLFRSFLYKMPIKKLSYIWDVFIREYLDTNDINTINDYEEKIKPYAALSVFNFIAKSDFPSFVSKILVGRIAKAFL